MSSALVAYFASRTSISCLAYTRVPERGKETGRLPSTHEELERFTIHGTYLRGAKWQIRCATNNPPRMMMDNPARTESLCLQTLAAPFSHSPPLPLRYLIIKQEIDTRTPSEERQTLDST